MPIGTIGKLGIGRRSGCGASNDSVVISVAVQNAVVEPEPAVGVHVTALPSATDPFMNCTVPVGPAPVLAVVTFAVSVILPPDGILVTLGVTVVVVGVVVAAVIVNVTAAELLAVKLLSPLYCATMECAPAAKEEIPAAVKASPVASTFTLLATVVAKPLMVSTKLTVPVGSSVPFGLITAERNRVTGPGPLVNFAKIPAPLDESTLATVVLLALPTVTVTAELELGANVPSPG